MGEAEGWVQTGECVDTTRPLGTVGGWVSPDRKGECIRESTAEWANARASKTTGMGSDAVMRAHIKGSAMKMKL